MEKDEIIKIRDEYSEMYNIAAYTKPVEYAVFLENKILAQNTEIRQSNDFITKQEQALNSVSRWAYLYDNAKPLMIGFIAAMLLNTTYKLVETIIIKIALIINS